MYMYEGCLSFSYMSSIHNHWNEEAAISIPCFNRVNHFTYIKSSHRILAAQQLIFPNHLKLKPAIGMAELKGDLR